MDLFHCGSDIDPIFNLQETFRPQQKQCEIKQESEIGKIKTEAQQSSNSQQISLPDVVELLPENETQNETETAEVRWFKCEKCRFLAISQSSLDSHSCPEQNRTQLNCPGCENIFFAQNSLQTHLLEDHAMLKEEVEVYMTQIQEKETGRKNKETSQNSDKNKRNDRIYIKNVELLKKPQETASKSKIYIKDVQTLRKPSQPQTSTDNFLDEIDYLEDDFTPFNPYNPGNENFNNSIVDTSQLQDFVDFQPTQQPQIFVRNVETLNSSQENFNYGDYFEDPASFPLESTSFNYENDRNRNKIFIKNMSVLQNPNQMQPNLLNSDNSQNYPTIHLKSVAELNSTIDNPQISTSGQTMTSSNTITQTQFMEFSAELHENMDYSGFSVQNNNPQNQEEDYQMNQVKNNSAEPFLDMYLNLSTPSADNSEKYHELNDSDFLIAPPNTRIESIEEIPDDPINVFESDGNNNEESNDNDVLESLVTSPSVPEIPRIDIPDSELPEKQASQPRIYVASNLMKESNKKSKGRPKGAKTIVFNTNSGSVEREHRCGIDKCGCRFAQRGILEYHRKCHSKESENGICCPECTKMDWKNWNSLHTHLWRSHGIDMELYKCDKCTFRTPNLSLLNNLHSKTHSDTRNFICEKCQKGFKNSKQLKNHRRIHRISEAKQKMFDEEGDGVKIIDSNGKIICVKCKRCFPTEAALLTHFEIHKQQTKNYQCSHCKFVTHDHNSFRRHNSKHAEHYPYQCKFCTYTSIQSTAYRKHIEKRHPEEAKNILFKCTKCKFTTINRTKFDNHQQKHNEASKSSSSLPTEEPQTVTAIIQEVPSTALVRQEDVMIIDLDKDDFPVSSILSTPNQNKIKVKSNLVLTDPNKYVNLSCSEFLHDILPNQINYTPVDNNVPLPPLLKTALFAKMDSNQSEQEQEENQFAMDSVLWTASS